MRSRLNLLHLLAAAAIATAVAFPATAAELAAKSTSAGGVTVEAVPRGITGPEWKFELSFNTHSQPLTDDPTVTAVLVADGRELRPKAWQGDPPGGHHRKGILVFAAPAPPPSRVDLKLQRPGEPSPRIFTWQLK